MNTASSVSSVIRRAQRGENLKAVFFGGSLTWGANASDPNVTSWRALTMDMLCDKYPKAHWRFKDSAIGGTGSSLGVFRMERDVFRHDPDLVLLDFTLNDGLEGGEAGINDSKNHSYEAIIRECVKRGVAVLPVFLTARKHVELTDITQLKRRLEHIEIFRQYNLEYADVLGLMNRDFLDEKINTAELWSQETNDAVHPCDTGYAAYAEYFRREWERIENSVEKTPVLPPQFISGESFSNLMRVELAQQMLQGWKVAAPCVVSDCFDWLSSRWLDNVIVQTTENGELKPLNFKVKAQRVAVMIETVSDSVPFSVAVDGAELQEIKVRSVLRSQLHYVVLADGLEPEKLHTISVVPSKNIGVMRWGAILLNSCSDISLKFV